MGRSTYWSGLLEDWCIPNQVYPIASTWYDWFRCMASHKKRDFLGTFCIPCWMGDAIWKKITTSEHKLTSKVWLNLNVCRHSLVYRYIQIWKNLWHLFMDGESTCWPWSRPNENSSGFGENLETKSNYQGKYFCVEGNARYFTMPSKACKSTC
jgi:hypothetical protein